MSKRLQDLADLVSGQLRGADQQISDVTHDSREAGEGALFVAVPGESVDGHDFVANAERSGAAAVAVEHAVDSSLPQLLVSDTRAVMGHLADAVHGHPSQALTVVGVTGTNGKTTVSYMLESIGRAAGVPSAAIGTTGLFVGGVLTPLPHTTPEASDLHRMLAQLLRDGVRFVALEVSSHAVALHRVAGVHFAAAGFTNLSQDHLDFHADMEAYFGAKSSFVRAAPVAVINVADDYGFRLATGLPALRVGEDLVATDVELRASSSSFSLKYRGQTEPVQLPIGGRFNVDNALVAAGLAVSLGVGLAEAAAGLTNSTPAPGRFEPIEGPGFTVIVDYAHSPDGIVAALRAAREIADGKVLAVVGAGGDRDTDKRAAMGRAASAADVVILTSDNPRNEDPSGIIQQVLAGVMAEGVDMEVEVDRRAAISLALSRAEPGDLVMILGKGHEATQEISGVKYPFDDRLVVQDLLAEIA